MKAYTDLEQSKKLAEILPIESADMRYSYYGNSKYNSTIAYKGEQWFLCQIGNRLPSDIPCWSLAALISFLPRFIEYKGDKYYLRFMKEYIEYANDEISITGICLHTTGNDNLVDACYEMIIKLNEFKML